jgi:hypothetical protein
MSYGIWDMGYGIMGDLEHHILHAYIQQKHTHTPYTS